MPPPATSSAISTATKVGVGVTGFAALSSVSAKISKTESSGSPNVANFVQKPKSPKAKFPEHYDTKNSNMIVKGNEDITTGKKFDKSLEEMKIPEVIELAKRRYQYFGNRGGSAMGKYQFVPGTLEEQSKALYGKDWVNKTFDERVQEDINSFYVFGNAKRLQKAGIPISDASLYMMHFFGNETQAGMVINGKDTDSMEDILDYWHNKGKQKAQPSNENPGVAKLTVGEYKKTYLKKYDFQPIDGTPIAKMTTEDFKSNNLNQSSVQNQDLKKQGASGTTVIMDNSQTNISQSAPSKQKTLAQGSSPDLPAHQQG